MSFDAPDGLIGVTALQELPWTASRFTAAAPPVDALEVARVHDEERRRLERDLHDGAQQRLVSLSVQLSRLALRLEPGSEEASILAAAQAELRASLAELRDLAHGLHPSVLTDHGLEAALDAICARAPVPVRLVFDVGRALPSPVEVTAYFFVCEALTNVAKYAQADSASVFITVIDGALVISVADDGVGGASLGPALPERLALLGGVVSVDSPVGVGTTLRAEIPLCVGL
jgi:signal transduction histidine kinase